jgi:DMSO/TMAO reductase YedYZ molybdopterin-dependent catalytic subunit
VATESGRIWWCIGESRSTPRAGLLALAEGPLTATDAFYVRGHAAVPEIDPEAWRLHVHGLVERELDLSLVTLREALPERELTATLQCAGNRRTGLIAIRDIPGEEPWGAGATGAAIWTGVALGDVLALAGPLREATHVGFAGADLCLQAKPTQHFGGSIPFDKACRPEVLLAWGMNEEPLPLVHGAPLRVVVPGYIGARSVKWLVRIEVRSRPWEGYFQQVAYRLLPPDGKPGPGAGMPLEGWSRSTPTCCLRSTETRSRLARSRCAATRSPVGSGTSRGSTSRSTADRAGRRRSCSRTSGGGPGDSGG